MATKTTVHLVDDLDGSDADETVQFSLDGVEYTVDLSSNNAEKLRGSLAEFIAASRRVGGRKQSSKGAGRKSSSNASDRDQNQAIRAWAREHGHEVSDRGRISQDLVVKFQEANPA